MIFVIDFIAMVWVWNIRLQLIACLLNASTTNSQHTIFTKVALDFGSRKSGIWPFFRNPGKSGSG